jgi:predicted pyridoxine 5'-phosphate oxidase superfamily flavin-nucleotide-binding protein
VIAGRCVAALSADRFCIACDDGTFGDLPDGPRAVCALIMIPGIREAVRLNGLAQRASAVDARRAFADAARESVLTVQMDESCLHCPEAFARSELWTAARQAEGCKPVSPGAGSGSALDADALAILARAPFALIATGSDETGVDVSPRGDPAGFLRVHEATSVLLPDRPGNRLALRNVLRHPHASLAVLVPGESRVLMLSGSARWPTTMPCCARWRSPTRPRSSRRASRSRTSDSSRSPGWLARESGIRALTSPAASYRRSAV